MCTVTINFNKDNTLITMNRDEEKLRDEQGLTALNEKGVEVILPIDKVSGGTWVATNNKGVTACLLNRYDVLQHKVAKSRGGIIPKILFLGSMRKIVKWLKTEFKPEDYSPFTLLLISKNSLCRFDWDGNSITKCDLDKKDWYMTTSSSWNSEEVVRWRHVEFRKWCAQNEKFQGGVPSYNMYSEKGKEEWSPFVERAKTHTKSITQILCNKRDTKVNYFSHDALEDKLDPDTQELKVKRW